MNMGCEIPSEVTEILKEHIHLWKKWGIETNVYGLGEKWISLETKWNGQIIMPIRIYPFTPPANYSSPELYVFIESEHFFSSFAITQNIREKAVLAITRITEHLIMTAAPVYAYTFMDDNLKSYYLVYYERHSASVHIVGEREDEDLVAIFKFFPEPQAWWEWEIKKWDITEMERKRVTSI